MTCCKAGGELSLDLTTSLLPVLHTHGPFHPLTAKYYGQAKQQAWQCIERGFFMSLSSRGTLHGEGIDVHGMAVHRGTIFQGLNHPASLQTSISRTPIILSIILESVHLFLLANYLRYSHSLQPLLNHIDHQSTPGCCPQWPAFAEARACPQMAPQPNSYIPF